MNARSLLECGSPLPLFLRDPHFHRSKRREPTPAQEGGFRSLCFLRDLLSRLSSTESARGLAQSKTWRLALAFCLLISTFCLCASAQDYTNKWFTVNGGGRSSTGGVYTITGTAGQPDAGVMRQGEYTVNGGFWGLIAVVQTPGAPPLTIRGAGSNSVLVCWPYPSESYGLQQCTNLTTANWAADASVPAHVGNEWQVTVSPPVGKKSVFYRLQKP